MKRRAIIAIAVVCVIAVAVLIAAVVYQAPVHSASFGGTGSPLRPGDIRFSGGPVPSPLYLSVGTSQSALNVYRVQTSLSAARRVTAYGQNRGVTGFTVGHDDRLVVSTVGKDGLEHIDLVEGKRSRRLPGVANAPALAPDGRLAYAAQFYRGYDGDVELVVDHGRTRPVFRVHDPDRIFESLWSPRGELALVIGSQDGATIVLDPGGPHQQKIPYAQLDPGFPGTNGVAFTPEGDLSYQPGDQTVIRTPSGAVRQLPLRGWNIECWTPNGKLIVTAPAEDPNITRIGAFDPRTNEVAELGRVQLGQVFQIVCPGT